MALRLLTFCAAFAFARWRAFALVMSSAPLLALTLGSAGPGASLRSNHVEQGVRPQPELEAAPWRGYSMIDRFSAEDLPFCPA